MKLFWYFNGVSQHHLMWKQHYFIKMLTREESYKEGQ